ncbi:aliphatic sulfonate ABC transporter substrate-binding protein [Metabacillus fastidiosus]|uniref:aliphatic sulfonate ABC transporter substrate-binding protein n=1 Tax=Metabacillus fastidiosus TaxID=1458 RepID=UPI002E23E4C8|nr:aliphatic sulfonate ABC transporter substrate-binding protein [Metabacillus fastidiosus]MED4455021.1 aliphatic sulfonate ABC transporter substrate-binding protein [Metabacillus fastidiosus]
MKKVKLSALITIISILLIIATGCGKPSESAVKSSEGKPDQSKEEVVVNIGIQHAIAPLVLAKQKQWFEEEFAKHNAKVNWVEVQGGQPQFDAILTNRLDLAVTGNTPVITAQISNIPFKEIAIGSTGSKNVALLLPKNSFVKELKELKGKKIAVAKGTAAYDILFRLLDKSGLKAGDVEIIQLNPDEAKAAFISGSVDAWSIGEPYLSTAVVDDGAVVLADGSTIDYVSPAFHVARTKFTEEHPELVTAYLKVLEKTLIWQNENLDEAVKIYSESTKLNENVVESVIKNVSFATLPVSDEYVKAQQELAKFLFNEKAVNKIVDPSEVVDNTFINEALKDAKSNK